MMKSLAVRLLAGHLLLWVVLAVAAAATAGPFGFASCWHIILYYVPPIGMALLAVGGLSAVVLALGAVVPAVRRGRGFVLAGHGMVFTAGWFGCNQVAYAAAGQVSCL